MTKLAKPKNKRHHTPQVCLTCERRETMDANRWYCKREISLGVIDVIYTDTDARIVQGVSRAVRQTCDRWKERVLG